MIVAPAMLGELHGGRADAAAHGVDEDRLAGLQPAAREQHVPGRRERDLQRRGLLVGHAVRKPYEVACADSDLLRIAAGRREAHEAGFDAERLATRAAVPAVLADVHQEDHGAIPRLPALDVRSCLGHAADDLDAEDVRGLDRETGDPLADVDVEMVESTRRDVEHDLARPGLRIVHVLHLQDVQASELVKDDCLHPAPPPAASRACVYV